MTKHIEQIGKRIEVFFLIIFIAFFGHSEMVNLAILLKTSWTVNSISSLWEKQSTDNQTIQIVLFNVIEFIIDPTFFNMTNTFSDGRSFHTKEDSSGE